jgi:hypothetical protein
MAGQMAHISLWFSLQPHFLNHTLHMGMAVLIYLQENKQTNLAEYSPHCSRAYFNGWCAGGN